MKFLRLGLIVAVLILTFLSGCVDRMREDLSPDLSINVIDQWTDISDPDGNAPMKDHSWLYVELNITNRNMDADHDIKFNRIFLGSDDGKKYWCMGILVDDELIEAGTSKSLVFFFELPEGTIPEWIEYTNTMGEKYRSYF